MSKEIAVIGSQEFTTGFRLAGVRRFEVVGDSTGVENGDGTGVDTEDGATADADQNELDEAVESVLEDDSVGIIVMHADDVATLSRSVRATVEGSIEPTLVALGEEGGGGGLRGQIRRAIGIDLMDE